MKSYERSDVRVMICSKEESPRFQYLGMSKEVRFLYGLLTLSDCDHNQGENDKAYEHDIQFVKP
ncbi:hypothetical protein VU08_08070, partial [Desulfobulbus sp. F5]|nr:hypothetical protein [Desulfobulbus sp. F5]